MSGAICGHDREALKWTLGVHVHSWCLMPPTTMPAEEGERVSNAVRDPAKLAEMLAEVGRWLGLNCAFVPFERAIQWTVTLNTVVCGRGVVCSYSGGIPLGQARAILRTWLDIPKGAHEEAERVLRGEP